MPGKGVEVEASGTAQGAAFLRAIAHREFPGERFGADHLADLFLPMHMRLLTPLAAKGSRIKKKIPAGLYEYLAARTAYFDEAFIRALEKDVAHIVLLGAGYDTRAYRFADRNKNTKIIELDIATTQDRKLSCLKKGKVPIPGAVAFASIDFNRESAEEVLARHGYERGKPALFLFEGVSYYLDPESVGATLGLAAGNAHPDTVIAFDYAAAVPPKDLEATHGAMELIRSMATRHPNEKPRFALEDAKLAAFLKDRGLNLLEHLDNRAIEARCLTRADGSPVGRITGLFRFVSASPDISADS